uniref:Guanine nucleotide-binding protein subunit gamma n=1 Tax=Eptatretus burgeri TaxID=7764 RepID=A0A8C4QDZ1_EPTBU
MSNNTANTTVMRRLVEHLKVEASLDRMKVSQAAGDLMQFCMQNACKDPLLTGMPAGNNPFREPRACTLL